MRRALSVLLLAASTLALAAPAPWYLWKSRADGSLFCAQASPGEGWERGTLPYADAGCRRPLRQP